jgi:hypothetical protein
MVATSFPMNTTKEVELNAVQAPDTQTEHSECLNSLVIGFSVTVLAAITFALGAFCVTFRR